MSGSMKSLIPSVPVGAQLTPLSSVETYPSYGGIFNARWLIF